MKLYEVWSVVLFAAYASVSAKSEETPELLSASSVKAIERDTRSFSTVSRGGNDAPLLNEEDKSKEKDVTPEIEKSMEVLDEIMKAIQNYTTEKSDHSGGRQSRFDFISSNEERNNTKVGGQRQPFSTFLNNYNVRSNNDAQMEMNKTNAIDRSSNDNSDDYDDGYQDDGNDDEENIESEIKNNFYNQLLKKYHHETDLHNNYGAESKNNKVNKILAEDNPSGLLPLNQPVKDLFTYNPIFDYLEKTRGNDVNVGRDDDENDNVGNIKRRIQHYHTVYQPNQLYFVNRYAPFNNGLPNFGYGNNNPVLNDVSIFNKGTPVPAGQHYQITSGGQVLQEQNFIVPKVPVVKDQVDVSNVQEQSIPELFNKPGVYNPSYVSVNPVHQKLYDDYFPIVIQNPFNAMWSAITNIVEYGPSADVCKHKKRDRYKKRKYNQRRGRSVKNDGFKVVEIPEEDVEDEPEEDETVEQIPEEGLDITHDFVVDGTKLFNKRIPIPQSAYDIPVPHIRRLKVRKGGVAIAGPGGIATAGSGGTAIVGPGGTAYTKPDGTAIVGPGGRLVHIPEYSSFPFIKKILGNKNKNEKTEPRTFKDPPGSRFIAMGPLIYYNVPPTESL